MGVSQKSIFKRPGQLWAINAHKMAPRTTQWLQERPWNAPTKGLLWLTRHVPPRISSEGRIADFQPSALHCTAGSSRSFTAIRKDAGLCCGSRLRKGEVFAYVGLPQNLKDLWRVCVGKNPIIVLGAYPERWGSRESSQTKFQLKKTWNFNSNKHRKSFKQSWVAASCAWCHPPPPCVPC